MQKALLILLTSFLTVQMCAQNSIGVQMGYLGTHTHIVEYERIDRHSFLIDSMFFDPDAGSFQAAVNIDLDLGKNFYLSGGFHYSEKGLNNVVFTDSTGWPWQTPARQYYVGLSMLVGYKYHFKESKFGLQVATGFKTDIAVGLPNGGALFSGPYYRFFMPFCRFNEIDFGWMSEGGGSYKLGPGDVVLKVSYIYGLSDVLEDAFVTGRTMSFGLSLGYSLKL